MQRNILAILAIIVALAAIHYEDMADFIRIDSCLDGGGRWLKHQQKCEITRNRQADLPEWMSKYVVLAEPPPIERQAER